MSTIQKIVLLGASGSLGGKILKALQDAQFEVTAITRPNGNRTFPSGVKVAQVEVTDTKALTETFRGQDAVIIALGWEGLQHQLGIIDAAIAAGVKRIFPAEFGGDIENDKTAALAQFAPKAEIEKYIQQKTQGTATSYTWVYTGAFLDWGFAYKFLLDLDTKTATMYDGGDIPFTVTPLDMVGAGVAAALKNPATENRAIRLHGAAVTHKQLLGLAQSVMGEEGWTVNEVSTAGVENFTGEDLGKSMFNIILSLYKSCIGEGYGGDMSHKNDNKLLGLNEVTEAGIKDYIKEVLESKK